jgi:hypothetical protein
VPRSGREVPALQQAKTLHKKAVASRFITAALGLAGCFSLFFALLIILLASPSMLVSLLLLGFGAMPGLAAALAWRRGRLLRRQTAEALEQARVVVAGDTLVAKKELTAPQLGKLMRLKEGEAEQLLARLNLEDTVTSHVTIDGEVIYSSRSSGRLRVFADVGEATEDSELSEAQATSAERATQPRHKP